MASQSQRLDNKTSETSLDKILIPTNISRMTPQQIAAIQHSISESISNGANVKLVKGCASLLSHFGSANDTVASLNIDGRYKEAKGVAEEYLRKFSSVFTEDENDEDLLDIKASLLMNLSNSCSYLSRHSIGREKALLHESIGIMNKAIAIRETLPGTTRNKAYIAKDFHNLGVFFTRLAEGIGAVNKREPLLKETREYNIKATKIRNKLYGSQPYDDKGLAFSNISKIEELLGNYKKAELALRSSISVYEKIPGGTVLDGYHRALRNLEALQLQMYQSYLESSLKYLTLGKLDSAESEIAEALKVVDDDREKYWRESAHGYEILRRIYSAKGDAVNVAAIVNFGLAIMKEFDKREIVESLKGLDKYQARLHQIREETKAELAACVLPSAAAPYPNQSSSQTVEEEGKEEGELKQCNEDGPATILHVKSADSIQSVYRRTNIKLRHFLKDLIEEIKTGKEYGRDVPALGEPPHSTKYAIICFGSLARDEASPYSDLELGILLDEATAAQDAAKLEEIKDYFRKLIKELNIRIINLSETSIIAQSIESIKDLKSPIKNGFSFYERRDPFELIRTPSQMAELRNEEWQNRDEHLSGAWMMSWAFIEGNEPSLEEQYHEDVDDILSRNA